MFNSLPIEITTAPRCFRKIQRSFDGPSLYEFNVLECGMAGGDFRNYYDNQKRFLVMLCKSNLVMSGAQCVRAVQLNVKEPRGQLSERNQETEMSLTVKAQFKDPETDESVLGVNFDINAFVSANSKVSVLGGDENRYGVTLDFRTFTPDETETDSFYQMPKVSDIMLTQRTDSYCTIRCFLRQLYINFLPEVMEKRKDDSLSHNLYTVHPDWNDVSNVLCTIPKKDEAFVMRDLCQEAKTACGHKAASLDDSTNGGFAETTTLFSSFGFQDCADLAGSKDIAAAKLAYKNRVLRSLKDLGLSEDYISQQWLKSKEWADKVQSSIKNGETPLTLLGIRENNLQLNGKASKEEAECIAKSLEYAWYMHERVREKKIRRKVITTVKRWRCNPFELASGQDREDHCFLSLGECHALPYNPDSPASLLLGADEKICNHMTEVECRSTDRDCGWFWNVNFDLSQRHKHPFVKMSYDGPPGIVNALANAGIGAIGMGANTVVKSVKFILRDHWKRIISDSVKYVKRDNAEKTSIDDSIKSASTDEATVNVNLQGDKSSYFNVNLFDHRLMTANMLLNTKDKTSNLINDVWHEHISRGYNLDLAAYLGNNEDQRVSAQLFVKKFDSDLISLFTAAINDVNRISNVGFELPDPIPLLPPVTLTEENLERRDQLDEEPPSEQLATSDVDSVLTGEDRADGNERQSFVSLNSRTTLSMKVAAVANTPEVRTSRRQFITHRHTDPPTYLFTRTHTSVLYRMPATRFFLSSLDHCFVRIYLYPCGKSFIRMFTHTSNPFHACPRR